MRLLMVLGMTGAGKSQTLYVLEDMGYFCVHNLPTAMLKQFVQLCRTQKNVEDLAVSLDLQEGSVQPLLAAVDDLQKDGIACDILFLDATEDVLIRRFKETRRLHPLQKMESLQQTIRQERAMLQPLRGRAAYLIDPSMLQVRQLKGRLLQLLQDADPIHTHVSIISFGYKYGLPAEADMVLDMRFLPNPFHVPQLKTHTGLEEDVKRYVLSFEESRLFLQEYTKLMDYLLPRFGEEGKNDFVLAVGCTGGMHRSVVMAGELQQALQQRGWHVSITHRDIERDRNRR